MTENTKVAKVSNTQVLINIRNGINGADKATLVQALGNTKSIYEGDTAHVGRERRWVCHAILDCLRGITDESTKAGMRQLVKKYLSGSALRDGEFQEYKELLVVVGMGDSIIA